MSVPSKLLLTLILTTLVGCVSTGRHWPEQTGRVLDADTQEPVEDAIVVARWIGTVSQLVDSQTVCYHVESATTDAQGRYRIPAWIKIPGKVYHNTINYTIYKSGYRRAREDTEKDTQYLKRDDRVGQKRLEYLSVMAVACGTKHDDQLKLLPLYQALYAEAKRIAVTNDEKKKAYYRLLDIEKIEIGVDEAWLRLDQRIKALE